MGFGPGLRGYIVFILLPPPGQCAAAKTKYKLWGKYIYIYIYIIKLQVSASDELASKTHAMIAE